MRNLRSTFLILFAFLVLCSGYSTYAQQSQIVEDIKVRGNAKVESDAIVTLLKSQKGAAFEEKKVAEDIRLLHELGYFSEIKVFKSETANGLVLTVEVKEKPSISSIKYEGMNEITEEDLKDKLETKIFTILNVASIQRDVAVIEKQYVDKGFYLARVSYRLVEKDDNETELTFVVEEGVIVQVGDVNILGNRFYSDADIISKLASRPITRAGSYSSQGSMFRDDSLKRDLEVIAYYYKDQGFADVKVAKPISTLDPDREFVRLDFRVEEGQQFYVKSLDVSGDLLFPKEELIDAMKLKPKGLFRVSQFQKDIEMLTDKYGDLGYAFVDINPRPKFNRDAVPPTVELNYEITKGEKVYFGTFTIIGNAKTRDNVIRREFEVADGELYGGTRLSATKKNIERLGYFEEVQAIKSRDEEKSDILNYKIKVKEKPTGQLSAAIGFQPGQESAENQWFGQAKYNEENQSGYGWQTNLSGKWNGGKNYELSSGFTNPRVDDSQWSLGLNAFLRNTVRKLTDEIDVQEKRHGGSVTVGRRIIEKIRGSVSYSASEIITTSDSFVIERLKEDGFKSTASLGLSRNSTNNYIDPSEGSVVRLTQAFSGGLLGGDFTYGESSVDSSVYYPIDFSDTYRTHFHLRGVAGYLFPISDEPVPLVERYRLGTFNDLRGFKQSQISPHINILQNPQGVRSRYNKGGDKQLFFQLEYFMPLIQEAGIKSLLFADAGRVFDDEEDMNFDDYYFDYGFGFRWMTPIGPFRFEWAYPVTDGKAGDMEFVLSVGM